MKVIAAFFIGVVLGSLPILISSMLLKHNMFIEIFDRLDNFYKDIKQ